MDIQLIENLIVLAKKHQVQALELEVQDWRVRVNTQTHTHSNAQSIPHSTVYNTLPLQTSTISPSEQISNEQHTQTKEQTIENTHKVNPLHTIVSPMLGTFYRKASPDAPAFVEVGQQVKIGDVVGIVEAMKMMYEVKAEQTGVVQNILLEDGAIVEYGQVLFELSQS